MQDTVWSALIGAIVRHLLLLVTAPLVVKGIVNDELLQRLLGEGGAQITAVIVAALVTLWSLRSKIIEWFKLKLAIESPANGATSRSLAANAAGISFTTKMAYALGFKSDE